MDNIRIAAYITAYKDVAALKRCVDAIKQQSYHVETIFIVDNSPIIISVPEKNDEIIISHHPQNIGVGGGLAKSLEWATNQTYDFLWTFDQDSFPTPNCLEVLLATYYQVSHKNNYNVGIIAPTAIDTVTGKIIEGAVFNGDHFVGMKHLNNVCFYECDSPITSGSLISLAAAKTISPPCSDLFIDGIDLDYGLRLKQKGFHNLIVTQAIMHHNFGNPVKIKFLNQERYIQQYSALRHYYICRNHTYLETRFSQGYYRLTSLMRRMKYMLVKIFVIILYDTEYKQLKVWACLLGTYHGLKGKLGKTW